MQESGHRRLIERPKVSELGGGYPGILRIQTAGFSCSGGTAAEMRWISSHKTVSIGAPKSQRQATSIAATMAAIEVAWRWLFGAPMLTVLWLEIQRISAAVPPEQENPGGLDAQNPWVAATQFTHLWALVSLRWPLSCTG